MIRTQIQLPEGLYLEAKRIAREQEMSLAEVLRRGVEHMQRVYPPRQQSRSEWTLPEPRAMGEFRVGEQQWRELANVPPRIKKP